MYSHMTPWPLHEPQTSRSTAGLQGYLLKGLESAMQTGTQMPLFSD